MDYEILAKPLAMRLETLLWILDAYVMLCITPKLSSLWTLRRPSTELSGVISLRNLGTFGFGKSVSAWFNLLYTSPHLSEWTTTTLTTSLCLGARDKGVHCPPCSLPLLLSPLLLRSDLIPTSQGWTGMALNRGYHSILMICVSIFPSLIYLYLVLSILN